jgi:hypothetical protein
MRSVQQQLVTDRSDHGNEGAYRARAEVLTTFYQGVERTTRTTRLPSIVEGEGGLLLQIESSESMALSESFFTAF